MLLRKLLIPVATAAIGFGSGSIYSTTQIRMQPRQNIILSILETQQLLKATGVKRYDPGDCDGNWGRNTDTALDAYICDRKERKSRTLMKGNEK